MTTTYLTEHIRVLGMIVAAVTYGYTIRQGGISFYVKVEPIIQLPNKEEKKAIYLAQGFLDTQDETKVYEILDMFSKNIKITK